MMSFGLINASATFQELVSRVLRDLGHYFLVYIDDIIIFCTNPEEHASHLKEIFDRFRAVNLRLHAARCHFGLPKIANLGHILSTEGVAVNESKVDVVQKFPQPKNSREVKSFLGLAEYYEIFIKGFATKTASLGLFYRRM
jgi:hypothetical protein